MDRLELEAKLDSFVRERGLQYSKIFNETRGNYLFASVCENKGKH
jgi:hypothetical protein